MSATFTVSGPHGKVIHSAPEPPLSWHESLRYFRLAQVTDDLYESFRNGYLAFESIASIRFPPLPPKPGSKRGEPEGLWLRRALHSIDSQCPLRHAFAPSTPDPVSEFIDEAYANVRCKLFHAKSISLILPRSTANRESVRKARTKVIAVVQMLVNAWLHGQSGPGFNLSSEAFAVGATAVLAMRSSL
jgi:hypothetical protein